MIVDIFDGDLYFHCLGKIKRSIKNSREKHFYLIKVTSEEYKKMYFFSFLFLLLIKSLKIQGIIIVTIILTGISIIYY